MKPYTHISSVMLYQLGFLLPASSIGGTSYQRCECMDLTPLKSWGLVPKKSEICTLKCYSLFVTNAMDQNRYLLTMQFWLISLSLLPCQHQLRSLYLGLPRSSVLTLRDYWTAPAQQFVLKLLKHYLQWTWVFCKFSKLLFYAYTI